MGNVQKDTTFDDARPNICNIQNEESNADQNEISSSYGLEPQPVAIDSDAHLISEQMFGGIFTTFQHQNVGLDDYQDHANQMGLTNIRWPGGTYAKDNQDKNDWDGDGDTNEFVYDLANPEVNLKAIGTGNLDFGLSGVMEYAVSNDVPFSMIVPVHRYIEDLEEGEEVLENFLVRLLVDKEFGELPSNFTLEMGNENISFGDVDYASDYGSVSNAFTSIITRFNNDSELNPDGIKLKVAIQGGKDIETDEAIRNEILAENYDTVDSVIFHYLSTNIRNLHNNVEERTEFISEWESEFGPDLNVFASAWTVGVSRYPEDFDHEYIDAGAEMSRTVIESIVAMSTSGVDSAAVWGMDINYSSDGTPHNPNWFSSGANGETVFSHGGHALRLLAESTPGTTLISAEGNQTHSGLLEDGEFPGLDSVARYVFQGEDQIVFFLAANTLSDGEENVEINVSHFTNDGNANIERITTRWHDQDNPYDDEAVIQTNEITIENGIFSVPISQDYEFVRVIVDFDPSILEDLNYEELNGSDDDDVFWVHGETQTVNDPTAEDNDTINSTFNYDLQLFAQNVENLELHNSAVVGRGNHLDNFIGGNAQNNILSGRGGDDTLFGSHGNDQLFGGTGNDVLSGGSGVDTMRGGQGDDTYIVDHRQDRFEEDENSGHDTVLTYIDLEVWRSSRNIESVRALGENDVDITANWQDNMLIGNRGDNLIYGLKGDDTLRGWAGDDTLSGGPGDDYLAGNRGEDKLFGGDGNDTLIGGSGDDTLLGGDGNDTLYVGSGNSIAEGGMGSDVFVISEYQGFSTFTDFELSQDSINLKLDELRLTRSEIIRNLTFSENDNGLLLSFQNGQQGGNFDIQFEGLGLQDESDILESIGI